MHLHPVVESWTTFNKNVLDGYLSFTVKLQKWPHRISSTTHIVMSPELHSFRTYSEHTGEESTILKKVRNVDVTRQFRKVHSYVGDVFPGVIP